jgi:N-acetyl-gamma-glutamyl-phosphate reductase
MINVSIAGGTGYTAGELLRILLHHPEVNIESVISTTSVGMSVSDIHRDLIGETDLVYSDTFKNPDVIFLCLGHGLSREFLEKNELPAGCKVIDLGNDFRNQPEFGNRKFVFGLCEQNREEIRKADNVAKYQIFNTIIIIIINSIYACMRGSSQFKGTFFNFSCFFIRESARINYYGVYFQPFFIH